ncbi:thiamine pyrophosphate-binding protein [Rhizobium grahamii]|uniref:Thiamine pyrophosphate-binding protein n=2 Tax=Rhizobium/Agrobacterium group TaxID=227290 RepID=A0A5Q0C8U6_9HYPH|nr:thiamine pyrophosphate-binding protein [Rhizobium grahamii]QRM51414.1 thiamine pyrophosphate-binding protein [Rhizobium sp. BG6]
MGKAFQSQSRGHELSQQQQDFYPDVRARARTIAKCGGINQALVSGMLPEILDLTLSEAMVLGLLRQGVRKYLAIFGHGSTDLAEVLRVYEEEGVTRTYNFRNEVAMAHAATALRWQYGEIAAVVTSIGPGALQAMAGSLAAASNGLGVYHIYGDETTFGEGYNMQQVPKDEQGIFGNITALMGRSYVLHTPQALREALRRGSVCVHHPYRAGPFYLLAPINVQPMVARFNISAMPEKPELPIVAPSQASPYAEAAKLISQASKVVIKAGGGARGTDDAIRRLAQAAGAVVVLSPGSTGVLRDDDPRNMHVGGSKGSISGNFAMSEADLLISVGSRSVCQADCSGIGYPRVQQVINVNGDVANALHYNRTVPLTGDIRAVVDRLVDALEALSEGNEAKAEWLQACARKKGEWLDYRSQRYAARDMVDRVWKVDVLTQPAAIKMVCDFAKHIDAAKFFDAGDVQANGFQIVEDDTSGDTYTETGASFMGFAASALLASGIAETPRYSIAFSGDGSFMMNPQVLIDAVEHGVKGMLVIFDNRRMAAISSLQHAQYGIDFKTNDSVEVDYVAMAGSVKGVLAVHGGTTAETLLDALDRAHAHPGLSVVHVPVFSGDNALSGLGAWGSWNVGSWVGDVQEKWMKQSL